MRFLLAPQKFHYLKHNWLTAFELFLPVVRIFRVARIVRVFGTVHDDDGIASEKSVRTACCLCQQSLQAKIAALRQEIRSHQNN